MTSRLLVVAPEDDSSESLTWSGYIFLMVTSHIQFHDFESNLLEHNHKIAVQI